MQLGSILDVLWSKDCYVIDVEQNTIFDILDGALLTARGYPFHPQEGEEVCLTVSIPSSMHGYVGATLQPHDETLKGEKALIVPEVGILLAGWLQLNSKKHRAKIKSADHFVPELLL